MSNKEFSDKLKAGIELAGKRMLEEKHIPAPSGGEKWPVRTIDMMLSNEKYYGSIVLFKTVTINYPYSKRVSNRTGAFANRYCITNGIEAIIDEVLTAPECAKAAEDVRNGEMKAIGFLVGQVMKKSKGKANPATVNELIKKKLS